MKPTEEPSRRITDAVDVSVVIPTHNRKALLRDAVTSIFNQSYPKNKYEIIVVDNSSTDGTDRMIEGLQKEAPCTLRYFKKNNEGPGLARNVGINNARGEIIAFTDSDCICDADWLKNGLGGFKNEDIALVAGRLLPKPEQQVTFLSPFGYVTEEHPFYPTNNIFYRRDVLIELGGFDGRFSYPAGGEDTELAWRVKRHGWKSFFSANVTVYHEVHRVTLIDRVFKGVWRWRRFPFVVKEVPELREKMLYLRVFKTRQRPMLYISVLGGVLAVLFASKLFLTLMIPYFAYFVRAFVLTVYGNPHDITKGLEKLAVWMVADLIDAFSMIYGSVRYGSIVL